MKPTTNKTKQKRNDKPFLILTTSFIALLFIISFSSIHQETNSITGYSIEQEPPFTINNIPYQEIFIGETFQPIDLNHYINYTNGKHSDITWSVRSNFHIDIQIIANIAFIDYMPKDWTGTELIEFVAKDNNNFEASKNVRFTVKPKQEGNNNPQLDYFDNIYGFTGELIKIEVTATDPDDDELEFIYGKPFDENGEWTPPLNFTNSTEIIEVDIKVVDGKGGFDQEKLIVLVSKKQEDTQPPIFYNVLHTNITQTSAVINIITNKNCKPTLNYSLGGDSPETSKQINNYSTNFSIKLENLDKNLKYFYYVSCTAENNKTTVSRIKSFIAKTQEIIIRTKFNEFDGKTTDFNQVNDLECVNYPILEKSNSGIINFTSTCINFKALDLDNNLEITSSKITFNKENLTTLKNHTIEIKFYTNRFSNPIIIKNRTYCEPETCKEINKTNEYIHYELPELDTYELMEEYSLNIRDNSNLNKEIANNITYKIYAEFLNKGVLTTQFPSTLKYKLINTTYTLNLSHANDRFYYDVNLTKPGMFHYNITINLTSIDKSFITKSSSVRIIDSKTCGNNICEEGENCLTCPSDCNCTTCKPEWVCSAWSPCKDGEQTRICEDQNNCSQTYTGETKKSCEVIDLCFNNQKDRGEEGIDCGGPCKPCEPKPTKPEEEEEEEDPVTKPKEDPKPSDPKKEQPTEEDTEKESKGFLGLIIALIILIILLGGTIGFYFYDKDQFMEWEEKIISIFNPKKNKTNNTKLHKPSEIKNEISDKPTEIKNEILHKAPRHNITKSQKKINNDEKYINEVLIGYKKGYNPQKITMSLSKLGLTKDRINKIFEEAKQRIKKEKQISIICKHLTKYNLSNIMVTKKIIEQNKFPKDLLFESLERVIKTKYPPNISHEILNQIKKL